MTKLVLLENGDIYFILNLRKNSRCFSLICFRRRDYLLLENDDVAVEIKEKEAENQSALSISE